MESTPIILLSIFVITTTVCCLGVHLRAIRDSGASLTLRGWIVYFLITGAIVIVLSPLFFFIFITMSDVMYQKVYEEFLK